MYCLFDLCQFKAMFHTDLSCSTLLLATSGPSWPTRLLRQTWDGYWTVSTCICSLKPLLCPPANIEDMFCLAPFSENWLFYRAKVVGMEVIEETSEVCTTHTLTLTPPTHAPSQVMPMWYLWTMVTWRWGPFRAHLMASGQLRLTTGSSNSQWANTSWIRWKSLRQKAEIRYHPNWPQLSV